MEVKVSLTVEVSQSEVQELRLTADYRREVQSIVVKAFADQGSASSPTSEVAEQQLLTVEVRVGIIHKGTGEISSPGHATYFSRTALIICVILRCIFRKWLGDSEISSTVSQKAAIRDSWRLLPKTLPHEHTCTDQPA